MRLGYIERIAQIESEARKLARSGRHVGFASIQLVLLARGYRDTAKVFANRWTQSELDRLCENARAATGVDHGEEASGRSQFTG